MNRARLRKVASETMSIVESGTYSVMQTVSVRDSVHNCVAQSRLYRPDELAALSQSLSAVPTHRVRETQFEVHNETTLNAARRLVVHQGQSSVLALNFASAIKPGGGFLNGAQAQEESLARASALHASLTKFPEFYDDNRALNSALYSDAMILSPECPVFRDDDDELLSQMYCVGFLTTPAVNAGRVESDEPHKLDQVLPVMRRRIDMLLAVAADQQYDHLVLGAWGCGVFRNDPAMIAPMFARALLDDARFRGRFASVVFAVLDWSEGLSIISPFLHHFAGVLSASTPSGAQSLPNAKLRPPVQLPQSAAVAVDTANAVATDAASIPGEQRSRQPKSAIGDETAVDDTADATDLSRQQTPDQDVPAEPEVKLLDDDAPAQQSLFD